MRRYLASALLCLAIIGLASPLADAAYIPAPTVCGSFAYKHITSATDTQIVAVSGSTTVYICDIEFSAAGAVNFYLEKSTSATCGTLTQIGPLWTLAANEAKAAMNPYERGFTTGASASLCVNTSSGGGLDIGVYYNQR